MTGSSRKQYLRRLFGYALNHKRLLIGTIATGSIAMVLPFVYPWIIAYLIDNIIEANTTPLPVRLNRLWVCTATGAVTALLFGITGYLRGTLNIKLSHRIVIDLRRDLFDHLQRLSLHFYSRTRTGSIVERIIHEVHHVTSILNAGIILVALDAAQLVIGLILIFRVSWQLALAVFFVLPLYVLTFRFYNPRVRAASERLHQDFCRIFGNVQEQLSNVALVKTYAAEERESAKFAEDNEKHYGHVVEQSHVGQMVTSISEVLIHAGTTVIIGFGGWLAVRGGRHLRAGEIVAFLGYMGIMYGPVRRFADLNIVYQNSLAAMRRVFRVFDITPRITEKHGAITAPPARGEVRYEGVFFRYNDDSDESRAGLDEEDGHLHRRGDQAEPVGDDTARHGRWILDGVDFAAKPGERIALVGPSGSGKTTLVSLLPRLYDVGQGRITIDGVDLRDFSLKALRSAIGIVQQDSFVFSGSLRDNLCYGRPLATEEEMIRAAKAANAHSFITALPDGYDTYLGERGVNLSGGQRQRISIARALLKDPRILILDEATSALDSESESLVQDALDTLMQSRTSIIIAHRLSTVRHADRILVLREGRIVEVGNHEELIDREGFYARLVRQQFGPQATQARLQTSILPA